MLKCSLNSKILFAAAIVVAAVVIAALNTLPIEKEEKKIPQEVLPPLLMLKDVGEPHLEDFGLKQSDFEGIKSAGFDVIESTFDICADVEDVTRFLNRAHAAELKVILPAGSGEAEWGYECDESYGREQKPLWQSERVREWVLHFSSHPALFAWDTSNEAGGNFPNEFMLTPQDLRRAYSDVKNADPKHPIMIRMNGWYFYDFDSDFFRTGNPFGSGVADIVMVNAYSNVEEYFPDFVSTVVSRARQSITELAPNTKLIVALGAWEEPPLWHKPPKEQFMLDYQAAKNIPQLQAIAIFKYGAEESDWWMPQDYSALWEIFRQ